MQVFRRKSDTKEVFASDEFIEEDIGEEVSTSNSEKEGDKYCLTKGFCGIILSLEYLTQICPFYHFAAIKYHSY